MNAFIKARRARFFTASESRGTVAEIKVPGKVPGKNSPLPAPALFAGAGGDAVPIRICPHCGYEIRTWILGDITCTRCENDILIGVGTKPNLYYRVSDLSCDTGS